MTIEEDPEVVPIEDEIEEDKIIRNLDLDLDQGIE